MLNLRTIFVSLVLVAAAVAAIGLTSLGTEPNLNPAGEAAAGAADQASAAALPYVDTTRLYRSKLGECFDVPVSEQAGCQKTRQPSRPSYRDHGDECFDVPIVELTECRKAGEAVAP